jgi:branched-chain amino acid transport system permease protein
MLTTAARSHTLLACLLVMLALAVLGVFPLGVTARYLLITSMAVGVAAVGVDILSGYGGLPFFGQGAFVGIGAYGETILRGKYNLSFIPATILTLLFTVVIAAVVGSVIVRLAHFGAALATFFLAFVVYTFLQGAQLQSLTQGENGLSVPSLSLGSLHFSFGTTPLYIASWLVLLVTVLVSHNYMNSRAGRALRQVKQSELIGGILGIDRWRVKLTAFVYAAVLGAVGGVVISFAVGYISPESFDQQESIYLFAMVAVGGMGSLAGPILGAVLFTLVPNYVGVAGKYQGVVFAVVLLGVLVFFPGGIYGALESLVHGLRARRRGTSVPAVPKLGRARKRSTGTSAKAPVATAQVKAETTGRSLRIGKLSARYRNVRALQDVSITVEAGAIHAIIGPNGAGKTTLLNCISGVQRAERGEIWVDDVRLDGASPSFVRARGVARTFQHPALVADLTVQENVTLGLHAVERWPLWRDLVGPMATARRERQLTAAAGSALDMVEFSVARRAMPASRLTLGEQKLVDIARALATRGGLLLMDEPTAGLSDHEMSMVGRVLARLRSESGMTIVLISHHVSFVADLADTVTVLDFGEVLTNGPADDVLHDERVLRAFIGPSEKSEL